MIKQLGKKFALFVTVIIVFLLLDFKVNYISSEAATTTKISTAAQLSQIVNNPSGDYELAADIDVSGLGLNNILFDDSVYFDISFEGTLDGKGYKITGVKQGLFRSVGTKGIIKNLNMEVDFSEDINAYRRIGLSFENYGTIDNVNISCKITFLSTAYNSTHSAYVLNNAGVIKNCKTNLSVTDVTSDRFCYVSGVAYINNGTITDITAQLYSDNVSLYGTCIAGICSENNAYAKISNCTIKGKLSSNGGEDDYYRDYLTGVAGDNYGTIDNCNNYCNITGGYGLSGITYDNEGIITSCNNYGTLNSTFSHSGISCEVGGITCRTNALIKDCTNYGAISVNCSSVDTGGISAICSDRGGNSIFDNCVNNGEITNIDPISRTGGIIGEITLSVWYTSSDANGYYGGTAMFKNCVNNAFCSSAWLAGGYSAECNESQIIVNNCNNTYGELPMYVIGWFGAHVSEDRMNSMLIVTDDCDSELKITNESNSVYMGNDYKLSIYNPENLKYNIIGKKADISILSVKEDIITGLEYGTEMVVVYTDTGVFDYIFVDVSEYQKVMLSTNFTIKQREELIYSYGIYYVDGVRLLARNSEIISVDNLGNAYANKAGTTDILVWYVYGWPPRRCIVEVVTPEDIKFTGWLQVDDNWYYYKNGEKCKGWVEISGKWYHMNSSGAMQTGWLYISGKWYYMNSKGTMQTGWVNDGGKWYYMNSSGAMQTGWLYISGKWYYMNSKGTMQTGWVNDGGKWYYMNSKGAMQTGWVNDGDKWYYMNSKGAMQTGWVSNGGKWYYMNSKGTMQTGWVNDGGKWYYMNSKGAMQTGWITDDNKWYYTDSKGVMKTGWLELSKKWYYFENTGVMVTGSKNISGKTYYFDNNGVWIK